MLMLVSATICTKQRAYMTMCPALGGECPLFHTSGFSTGSFVSQFSKFLHRVPEQRHCNRFFRFSAL